MTPLLLSITVLALVGFVPIVLALNAKRFGASSCVFSCWIVLGVIFSILTVASTGCNLNNLGFGSRTKTVLVYEVFLPDELQNTDTEQTVQDFLSTRYRFQILANVLKKRIDPHAKKTISVIPCDSNRIAVVIPENDDAEIARLKKFISLTGTVEFRIVADKERPEDNELIDLAMKSDNRIVKIQTGKNEQGEPVYTVRGMWVPVTVGQEKEFNTSNYATRTRTVNDAVIMEVLCIKDIYNVSGQYFDQASAGHDRLGNCCVNFKFNSEGGNRFFKLTSMNLPDGGRFRHLGIILNGELYSAPRINSPIRDRGEITGSFTNDEVNQMVDVIMSGTLPVRLSKEPVFETSFE